MVRRVLQAGRQNATLEDSKRKEETSSSYMHAGAGSQDDRSRPDKCQMLKRPVRVAGIWWLSQNSTAVDVCVSAVFLKRCGAHSLVSVSRGEYWLDFPVLSGQGLGAKKDVKWCPR